MIAWLTGTTVGKFIVTFFISMVPVVELRLGLPYGIALGLPYEIAAGMTLIMALPVMTVVPMIAKQYGNEGDFAAGITVATLVICMVTIPVVAYVAL